MKFKRMAILLLLNIFLAASLWGCASGDGEPFPDSQPAVRDLSSIEERLVEAVSSSEQLFLERIGEVTYGEFSAPVWLIIFNLLPQPEHRVFFSGGVHGNEPAGVEALIQFIEDLAGDPAKYQHYSFEIIPLVNPWGWVHDVRFNRDGIDINRDFSFYSFKTQEAVLVRDYLGKIKYDLMIDLHESPGAQGYYLYQSGNPDTSVSRSVIEAVREGGYPIEQDVSMVILKTDDGLIDAPMWGLWVMEVTCQQSAAGYYRMRNTRLAHTTETPTHLDMADRVLMQRLTLDLILESLE